MDFSESWHEHIPLKTTSLSISSLFRADANLPLHSFASVSHDSSSHVQTCHIQLRWDDRTKPVALSAFQAAPVEATDIGVSDRFRIEGCDRFAALTIKLEAICIASS